MTRVAACALLLLLGATPATAAITYSGPQLLPIPGVTEAVPVPNPPAPLAPPIASGYAPSAPSGLSPILTAPAGPVYEPPVLSAPAYPPQPLPGPIDQQKLTAYRNDLRAQQWQMQSQGFALGSTVRGREILQQLNAPDMQ